MGQGDGIAVAQAGFGAFGPVHLQAWLRILPPDRLWLVDPDPAALARARRLGQRGDRVSPDLATVLEEVGAVDILTPTPQHAPLATMALAAGRDVFCEKPMTLEVTEAERLAALADRHGRVFQVGYYFRHHPLFRWARDKVREGALGRLRYLRGTFAGFKRARGDVGVTASDAVHFIDYFNWIVGAGPERVLAVQRDHFGRGLDDLALILLAYPDGVIGKVEAGLIQPGRHVDLITPGALTSKDVALCGAAGAIEIDFPAERLTWHRVRHQRQADGLFHPVYDDALVPRRPVATAVDVLESQFRAFLGHVADRSRPEADVRACGVVIARILAAIQRSAAGGGWVDLP